MTCSSCENLKEKEKAQGKMGCKYKCSKLKTYVSGDMEACDKYKKSYSRSNFRCDEIFKEGREFYNDKISPGGYLVILIILIVLLIIVKIFNLG